MPMTVSAKSPAQRPAHPLLVGVAIAAAHFGVNWLGHIVAPSSLTSSLLWPGPGFALAILLLCGARYWPAIAIGSFAFGVWVTGSFPFALVIATALLLLVLPTIAWLRRRAFDLPLAGTRNVLELLFAAVVVMPLIGATMITIGMRAIGQFAHYSTLEIEAISWTTISAGTLFSAPMVLAWAARPQLRWRPARVTEGVLLGSSALVSGLLVYSGLMAERRVLGLSYVAFPFMMWAALRFGLGGVAALASMVIAIAMAGTAHGHGIFTHRNPEVAILFVDGFSITLAGTALLIGAAIDEARRSMRALRESEAAYRRLTAGASDAILLASPEGRLIDVNARATELLGYARGELIGRLDLDLIDPRDLAERPSHAETFRVGHPILIERRYRRRDGTLVDVEVSATRLEDGRFLRIVRDISERKRAEAELREALSLVQATLESTTDGILVVDQLGRIRNFNHKFVELWGIPDDVLASRDDERALAFVLDQLKEPEAFLTQVRHLYGHPNETSYDLLEFKDGRLYERYSQAHTVGGVVQGRVWSFRDITQRLKLEGQLRHAQKMEAVGSLAGGVAHDFNNLLTAIMGHSSLLLARMGEPDPLREDVAEIHRASERAALLTRQLLSFSRQQVIETRVLDLNRVVRSMEQMLSRTLGETIQVVLDAAPAPLWIRADSGELEQVMLNLAINARDAMPGGGKLHLQTAPARIDADETRLELRAGEYARLSFQDTGVGLDPSTRARIFDPFFTTKERGRGTGLGLSAVYGIMKQSGGAVTVESEPGRGARFDLYFPLVAPEPERIEAARGADAPPRGHGRVLLVEDEDMVRDLLREALASAGFDVIAASHGPEALEALERDGAPIDLLVTDVVMPRMSGPELARRLSEHRAGLRVLFISGYTADELSNRVSFDHGTGFLQKPFSPPALIRKIHELLEAPVGG